MVTPRSLPASGRAGPPLRGEALRPSPAILVCASLTSTQNHRPGNGFAQVRREARPVTGFGDATQKRRKRGFAALSTVTPRPGALNGRSGM